MNTGILRRTARHYGRQALLGGVVLCSLLAGCASNPTGGTDFVLMSENAEIEKGNEIHAEMLKENPIYQDPELQAYVERVGRKMAAISHRPELKYTFTIIDSPEINAFALPGGHVYVNRGLLTYLTKEDQLAAVLGHEIGHITARHAVRQQTAARTANAASTAANIAVLVATAGMTTLGSTGDLIGGALLSGYGREMELEADGLGAEYLFKAGYDPNAMVEVISVLKNQEDFRKKTGQGGQSYHGLFSTHPRNDTRLREVVGTASTLAESEREIAEEADPASFRQAIAGLPVGRTQLGTNTQDRNRYYQTLLSYTLVFPDEWAKEETPTTVTASSADKSGVLRVEARQLQGMKDPRLFISDDLGIKSLKSSERLSQFGLSGYTGINPDTGERVAVFYYGPRAFILTGSGEGEKADEVLMNSIRSFRPIANNEYAIANPVKIEWIQADGKLTYADLAGYSRLNQYAVEMLRLMNGHYPSGEPKAGEWIKIAR